jgi:hypothetical protein
MHWATYRAILRRHGEWHRNLNEELLNPMTKQIASSWAKVRYCVFRNRTSIFRLTKFIYVPQVFETNMFDTFQAKTRVVINRLLADVERSAPSALRDRVKQQGELTQEDAALALKKASTAWKKQLKTSRRRFLVVSNRMYRISSSIHTKSRWRSVAVVVSPVKKYVIFDKFNIIHS